MAINFPTNPALNDTYTYQGNSWQWNGTAWDIVQASLTYTSVVNGLGYPPLSIYGGQIQGDLTVTGNVTVVKTLTYGSGSVGFTDITATGNLTVSKETTLFGNVGVGTSTVLTSAAGKTVLSVSGPSGSYVTLGTANVGLGSIFADTNFGINGSSGTLYIINSAANQPIVFQSGSSYTERMRIDANGKLGIGTSAPFAGTTTFVNTNDPVISQDGGYYGGGLYWDSAWRNTVSSQGGWSIRNSSGIFTVYTGAANSVAGSTISAAERLRIDANGNVGIGTTATSAYKMNVNGTIAGSGTGITDITNTMKKLIGPTSIAGGATFTITNFPSDWREHYIYLDNFSHSNTSANGVHATIEFSTNNGSTWNTPLKFAGLIDDSSWIFAIHLWNLSGNTAAEAYGGAGRSFISSDFWYGSATAPYTGAVNAIRIGINGTGILDLGTITVYGIY